MAETKKKTVNKPTKKYSKCGKLLIILIVVLGLAGGGYLFRNELISMFFPQITEKLNSLKSDIELEIKKFQESLKPDTEMTYTSLDLGIGFKGGTITLKGVAFKNLKDGMVMEVGDVKGSIIPGDQSISFDVDVPNIIKIVSTDSSQPPISISFESETIKGTWLTEMNILQDLDLRLPKFNIIVPDTIDIQTKTVDLEAKLNEDSPGVFSGPATFRIEELKLLNLEHNHDVAHSEKDQKSETKPVASFGKIEFSVNTKGLNAREIARIFKELNLDSNPYQGKTADQVVNGLFFNEKYMAATISIFGLVDSVIYSFSAQSVEMPDFSAKDTSLSIELKDLAKENGVITLQSSIRDQESPQAGFTGSDLVPNTQELIVHLNNINIQKIYADTMHAVQQATQMGATPEMINPVLGQVFMQSVVTGNPNLEINVEKLMIDLPIAGISAGALIKGFQQPIPSAAIHLECRDIEKVLNNFQMFIPQVAMQWWGVFAALAEQGQDSKNRAVLKFNIDVDSTGKTIVNGRDLDPILKSLPK